MKTNTISIDLAKNIFQVIGFDKHHKIQFNKRLKREQLVIFINKQCKCRLVMEACYSSHYWGRVFQSMGHTVELIPAQHVTPFVRGNKNDTNDAIAIYEASNRPNIKPVPIKTEAQQEILMLHRIRERLLRQRVATTNQIKGLLVDFGIIFPKGLKAFEKKVNELKEDMQIRPLIRRIIIDINDEYQGLVKRIKSIELTLKKMIEKDPTSQILLSIPGIGLINASAFAASIDKGQAFNTAKDFGVWLGLTPKQFASGDKSVMSGITKRGNCYLRKQLIHGARAIVTRASNKPDQLSVWITQLRARKSFNCTVVATAHKLARLMWVLLHKQTHYKAQLLNNNV